MTPIEVHKFGGTSVGEASRIVDVARLVASFPRDARHVVVVSAMAGITDRLVEAASRAAAGERAGALALGAAILARHEEALHALALWDVAEVRTRCAPPSTSCVTCSAR